LIAVVSVKRSEMICPSANSWWLVDAKLTNMQLFLIDGKFYL
jgi:hypothetical protein